MACESDGFLGDTFLQAAVAMQCENVLVEERVLGCVKLCCSTLAGQCVADRVANPLAEWASGGFNADGIAKLRGDPVFLIRVGGIG